MNARTVLITLDVLRFSAQNPDSRSELLILYTTDATEWASYLQQIMAPTVESHRSSILLHALDPNDQLHGYDLEYLHECTCIVLLLTATLLDMLYEPELEGALQRLLHPPHRVVALLCGVSEDNGLERSFQDWSMWRKLSAEDEPNVYISTILDCITESMHSLHSIDTYIYYYLYTISTTIDLIICIYICVCRLQTFKLPKGQSNGSFQSNHLIL